MAAGTPATSIDFRRLGRGDLVAVIATAVVFISLFLPWYSYTDTNASDGCGVTAGSSCSLSISALGSGAGGWRFLILVICLLVAGLLFLRSFLVSGLRTPLPHWQLLTALCSLNLLLIVISFLVKPGFYGLLAAAGISSSWSYGAFIGLIAGIAAVVGGSMRRTEPETIVPGVGPPAWAPRPTPSPSQTYAQPRAAYSPPEPTQSYSPPEPTPEPPQEQRPATAACANCGAALAPGNTFCTGCGQPVL
ncbi:MAG: hypothetical protein ACRD0Z_14285 [Acidimicrobiales bacterium]